MKTILNLFKSALQLKDSDVPATVPNLGGEAVMLFRYEGRLYRLTLSEINKEIKSLP